MARSTTATDTVGVRHIIGSILVDPDSTANQKMTRSGVSLPLVREKLLKAFSRRWLNDDGQQWQLLLVGSSLPTIAEIYADTAGHGEDRLGVDRYARAFATEIAAERVNPPFSIGIFGDWGSGKSFFMRLMSEHTQKMSEFGDAGKDGKRLFCRHIVSIPFNAWQYAETELLASFVQTILLGLRIAIVGDQGDSEAMDKILSKLDIAKVAHGEAKARLEQARTEKDRRAEKLAKAQEEAQQRAEAVQQVRSKDVVEAVRKVILPQDTFNDALVVAKRLGLDGIDDLRKGGEKTAGDLMRIIEDARITSARTRSAWDWLLKAPINWWELISWAAGALALLALGLAVAIRLRQSWPAFYGLAINALGFAALGTGWVKRQLSFVSKGLDQFDQVRQRIDAELLRRRSEVDTELARAQRGYQASTTALEQAESEFVEAQAAIAKAEQDVQESRSISRIARLLDDRITNKSYERYLGIVAAVRADFQKLSDYLKGMQADRGETVDKLEAVDRIVLYIDDLDRCPADKVVAVLEAIHLLLAFELFVVVVGVDIRWAAKSLVEKYPQHLTAGVYEGGETSAFSTDGVTALDYLEKIFQPFWLPPMDEDASRNMIAEMVPRVLESGLKPGPIEAKPEEISSDVENVQQQQTTVDAKTAPPESRANALSLFIEPEERNFMLQLAGAVGKSPRRLKRFVSTYRILKASLDKLQQETFVLKAGSQGEYRAAMALLAIVAGAPKSSLGMLEFLANSAESTDITAFETYLKNSADSAEQKHAQAALEAYRRAETRADIEVLRRWAPQVARFSFRSGRA